jgi:hypothetical protein
MAYDCCVKCKFNYTDSKHITFDSNDSKIHCTIPYFLPRLHGKCSSFLDKEEEAKKDIEMTIHDLKSKISVIEYRLKNLEESFLKNNKCF